MEKNKGIKTLVNKSVETVKQTMEQSKIFALDQSSILNDYSAHQIFKNTKLDYEQIAEIFSDEKNIMEQQKFSQNDLDKAKLLIEEEINSIKSTDANAYLRYQLLKRKRENLEIMEMITNIHCEIHNLKNGHPAYVLEMLEELNTTEYNRKVLIDSQVFCCSKVKKTKINEELLALQQYKYELEQSLKNYILEQASDIRSAKVQLDNLINQVVENNILIKHMDIGVQKTDEKSLKPEEQSQSNIQAVDLLKNKKTNYMQQIM